MDHIDFPLVYFISEPIEAKIQVLHVTVVLRILSHRECRAIVYVESGRGIKGVAQLCKQIAQPEDLLTSRGCSNILCFSGGECNNALKATGPADRTIAHLHNITAGRATIVRVPSMVSICVSGEKIRRGSRASVGKPIVKRCWD